MVNPRPHASIGICAATLAAVLSIPGTISLAAANKDKEKEVKKPGLSVKASPNVSFAPARIKAVAELKGGPNDYEDYYCAGVEWDWGDGTTSGSSTDCEPYEAGKSEIQRRFFKDHEFHQAGSFRIQVRLMRKNKALAAAGVTVQVRPGLRDGVTD
jgi:hypothetical protein